MPLPPIRLRATRQEAGSGVYVFRLNEIPIAEGTLPLDAILVLAAAEKLQAQGFAAEATLHPDGTPAAWIPRDRADWISTSGSPALTIEEVMLAHLYLVLRRHAHEFITLQETQILLDGLERTHPALVREVVPKLISPVLLTDVLRRLAEEGVSLRPLKEILGALAEWAAHERDPVALTEHARAALRRAITFQHAQAAGANDRTLGVFLIDPMIEDAIRDSIQRTASGSYLALEPDLSREIIRRVGDTVANTKRPVLLTASDVRRFVRRLVETEFPEIAVLSYQELSPDAKLQPLGRVQIG